MVGGARLEDDNHKSFQKEFGVEIYKTYGLTETCSIATCDCREKESRVVGSSGKPIMVNEIQIFNLSLQYKPINHRRVDTSNTKKVKK